MEQDKAANQDKDQKSGGSAAIGIGTQQVARPLFLAHNGSPS